MKRYRIDITYDGSNYSGWQVQPDARTIQGEIEKNLEIVLKESIRLIASGRTDAGVHAFQQTAHFDTDKEFEPIRIRRSLDGLLDNDVRILNIENVDQNFHARSSVISKKYLYYISTNITSSPLLEKKVYSIFRKLNINEMKTAAKKIIGTYDFSSFRASDCCANTTVRTIEEVDIKETQLMHWPVLELSFVGNGFLKHMVRNIVGTLLEVGYNNMNADKFFDILKARDRMQAGPTAPAHGLYLKEIKYL